ncbi:Demethylmenaquinone methyltransferase [Anaerohalosphaera lusitana]|uniref:Demethylmenaquinone methyltransferase n=1 Tax=Anaerohalosphaera lusitana TaxID=1936003 RepID=A0A1U9NIH9_9BACT|nr:bifunctional demethylmenaquinone methyltransferase/2-methoxy-6-polyprenyl-1,4-benzoquinol methylase UbiE [Anaerohalosphaera lusitana]AQT67733.1 Demethylmenaquinone methyltransferase [Anaerohalosphaera lusitana]
MSSGKSKLDIKKLFDDLACRYDLINRVLSAGTDMHWRKKAIEFAAPSAGMRILDMCCGTGDVVFAFDEHLDRKAELVGCDFSEEMISIAKKRTTKKYGGAENAHPRHIEWLVGDCQSTDLDGGSFDIVSCAFGVRNMNDRQAGLREMHRLLKPGGRTCILEFSLPQNFLFRFLGLTYLSVFLPIIGGIFSGRIRAYRYLSRSIRTWDREVDLTAELQQAGFSRTDVHRLGIGMAAVHVAHK